MPRFGSLRIGANGRVPVSSGFRVMSFRRRPCERRARLTHHVLQLPNCHVDAVYFLRDLQIFLLHVYRQVSGGVFQTVARNVTRLQDRFFHHRVKFSRHAGGGGIDVRSLRRVVADRSGNRWNRSSWFCARSIIWITAPIQARRGSWSLRLPTRKRRRKAHILTHPVMFDQSAKQYVVFRLASRAGVCEAQSRINSEGRTGRRTRTMICIRFEAMPRTLRRRAPELQCSRHREIGWIVKGSRVELPCSIKHLRCCLCCACRLATSQAFAPYRRSTSSVSSATFAVLGCRVASSPSDEEDCCLWISALRLPSSALPLDGCCRVFDGRTWSLSKRTEANDMGCDTGRVPLG